MCTGDVCQVPSCSDGVQNGDETDADCGNSCGATCTLGEACGDATDCVSGLCDAAVCSTIWYQDTDGDGFGDIGSSQTSPTSPGADWVTNSDDCDDSSGDTFPGAAPNDSATACMADLDGDDYGDDDPPPGVTAGTDCNDASAAVQACLTALTDDPCIQVSVGASTPIGATATGGTGSYTYSWSPSTGLDDANSQNPTATVSETTTYVVTVDDGVSTSDDFVTVIPNAFLNLENACTLYTGDLSGGTPDATISYTNGGTTACENNNHDLGLHLCEEVQYENVRFEADLGVYTGSDDDYMGVVWGGQDASHFYLLAWKQLPQTGFVWDCGGAGVPAGMVVKRIEADSFSDITADDWFCESDTTNSTLLLDTSETTGLGWVDNETYSATVDFTPTGTTITVADSSDATVASFVVNDLTYTTGYFGTMTFSQSDACLTDLIASCL